MDDKNLENTRALNDLSDLVKKEEERDLSLPIDQVKEEPISSEELYNNLVTKEVNIVKEPVNKKMSLNDIWHKLSKKNKIIIIVSAVSIIVISLITTLIVLNHNKKTVVEEEKTVLAADNYIYEDGVLTILDSETNPIGKYTCNNKDENLCYVAYLTNDEDLFEVPINEYSEDNIIRSRSQVYYNKYIFITDQSEATNDIIYLYNLESNEVMGEYLGVKAYANHQYNLILKNKSNKYGLFELTNDSLKTIIDYSYTYMGIINKENDNKIVVKNNKSSYLIDFDNKVLTKNLTGDIIDYNDSYIVLKDSSNKYNIYDYNNTQYNTGYDYIRLISDKYIGVVSDSKLAIRDVSENKYNEDTIVLNNNKYIPVNTYDQDKKKINTDYSFNITLTNNICSVSVHSETGNSETNINLSEGEASTKYNYFNYFNGKLYFYSDDAKTKLLGEYTCNNGNVIGSDYTLNNCNIATDTVLNDNYLSPANARSSTIPLYNDQFIFIYDSPINATDSNREIKFYDLKNNKTLGTYSLIDSGTPDNKFALGLVTTSETTLIAKLKSGKYGTIIINSNSAKVGYKFEFNYLERFGKYYLAQNEDNTWQVIYSNDTKSYSFSNKILNINTKYAVVKVSDGVRLYKVDASEVINKSYKYIELTDSQVFGAVDDNNKLYIITYEGTILNPEGISLPTMNYYNTDTPAFKLSVVGNYVMVSVYDGNSYSNNIKVNITNDSEVQNETEE